MRAEPASRPGQVDPATARRMTRRASGARSCGLTRLTGASALSRLQRGVRS